MKGLILAGGYGKRLRPLTYSIPKQLVPIANRPIISYVVDQIRSAGISEIGVIISPHTGTQIKEVLKNESDLQFTFILQREPLGLAHAVMIARDYLGDEPFLMYLGDNLIGEPISQLIRDFDPKKEDGLILLKEVDDPRMFGVAITDERGEVVGLVEKPEEPPSKLALVGVYLFNTQIHSAIDRLKPSSRGEFEITDAITTLIKQGRKIRSKILSGWWLDTGKKDDLLAANRIILSRYHQHRIEGKVDTKTRVEGEVTIDSGTRIIASHLRGPLVIGKGCEIASSHIGPYTAIGNSCRIINSNIVESVIMEGARVESIPSLSHSIIGRKARVVKGEGEGMQLLIGDDASILL
ncbi:glucose-1-phosphate thymidylyltransferase [candidate division WOR-3 bacterium]|uniref:Glucose-1-phosphate thymidylyltransferase n=1 Tax=candidate division WOR-3 bacterium TaxID=2052148 RepID=A0A660SJP6_UNCW3|nr:MAG: glucose-1-phosphate thymidylyltransferase [candidate division WOR-3 bacterium]